MSQQALFPITITIHSLEQLDRVRALFWGDVTNKNVQTEKVATPAGKNATPATATAAPTTGPFTADQAGAYTAKLIEAGKKPWVLEQIKNKYKKANAKQLDDAERAEYMTAAMAAFPDIKL